MNGEMEIDIGRVLSALWRRKGRLLLAAAVCAVLTLAGSLLVATPKYSSTVLFYVTGSGESLSDSCIIMLKTEETLAGVIEKSGTAIDSEALEKRITAQTLDAKPFFSVTVTAEDPVEARAAADAVAEVLPQRMGQIEGEITLKVAAAPKTAKKPSSPDNLQNALIGALAGFTAAGLWIALREIFCGDGNGKYECRHAGRAAAHK